MINYGPTAVFASPPLAHSLGQYPSTLFILSSSSISITNIRGHTTAQNVTFFISRRSFWSPSAENPSNTRHVDLDHDVREHQPPSEHVFPADGVVEAAKPGRNHDSGFQRTRSGIPGPGWHKEKFTMVDNEKRVKEVEVVEGGYRELGFTFYLIRFEITEAGSSTPSSCIIKTTVEYELKEEAAAMVSFVSVDLFANIAHIAKHHLLKKHTEQLSSQVLV